MARIQVTSDQGDITLDLVTHLGDTIEEQAKIIPQVMRAIETAWISEQSTKGTE